MGFFYPNSWANSLGEENSFIPFKNWPWVKPCTYIIINFIKSYCQHRFPSVSISLSIRPYHPSLLAGPLNYIQCPYKPDLSLCWSANANEFIEHPLWVCPYFSCSVPLVSSVLLGWLVRWEVSGCTDAVLLSVAFRIYSKQHVAFCWVPIKLFVSVHKYN